LNGFFYGIPHKPFIPFIAEGLFCPDHGLQNPLERIFTGLTDIPVGNVKIITSRHRLLDGMFTNITCQGLHVHTPFKFQMDMYMIAYILGNVEISGRIP
jgi:hypothetical protein